MNCLGTSVGIDPLQQSDLGLRLFDPYQVQLQPELDTLRQLQRKRAEEGSMVLDLSMVNPDLAPPRLVLDRLLESVTKTVNHRYAVSRGVRRLREAFSYKYKNYFGHVLDPETQVCACLGSKDATFHALRVLLEPGDKVVISVPTYPAHTSAVVMAGGQYLPWEVTMCPQQASKTLAEILSCSQARVLLLNFPANPTGAMVSREWWLAVGKVCAEHGVTILNDFVYGEMCFSGIAAESALCVGEVGARSLEVYSLSKAYNVPGWRVGALVGDAQVVGYVSQLKAQADYGLFLPLQYAAAQALIAPEDLVSPTVDVYRRRLKVLSDGLKGIGWRVEAPEAGACLWAEFPEALGRASQWSRFSSINAARYLLVEGGVVVTPGVVFGEAFDSRLRLAAVQSEERLRDVVNIIRELSRG